MERECIYHQEGDGQTGVHVLRNLFKSSPEGMLIDFRERGGEREGERET